MKHGADGGNLCKAFQVDILLLDAPGSALAVTDL